MTHAAFVGRSETREDSVWPLLARGLAATVGAREPARELPPLWHWALFQDWVPAEALGPDGHPRRGGFLPPAHDLPRRMWAGGRLVFHANLPLHADVTRVSTIQSVTEKQGASGRLLFVTVRHEIASLAGLAITEEQDLVYRGTEGAAVKRASAAPAVAAEATRTLHPDPVLLFRYSALTGNGRRIHDDADYVRDEEGYPGLIVHGPLQATWLAALAQTIAPFTRFAYWGRRPAFAGNALLLEAWRDGDVTRLRSLDHTGAVCMTAEAGA
ncbi:MAG: MaoC family dehydratase N-terminal domain-containing protein [Acetobacteraceae bacterium]